MKGFAGVREKRFKSGIESYKKIVRLRSIVSNFTKLDDYQVYAIAFCMARARTCIYRVTFIHSYNPKW